LKHSCTETRGYTVIIGAPNSNSIKDPVQQVLKKLVWTRTTDDSFIEENQTTQKHVADHRRDLGECEKRKGDRLVWPTQFKDGPVQ
jgi:hypothetical protein